MYFAQTSNFEGFPAVAWVRQLGFHNCSFSPLLDICPLVLSHVNIHFCCSLAPFHGCLRLSIYVFTCVCLCVDVCLYFHVCLCVFLCVCLHLHQRVSLDLGVWVIFDCLCHARNAFNAQSTQVLPLYRFSVQKKIEKILDFLDVCLCKLKIANFVC